MVVPYTEKVVRAFVDRGLVTEEQLEKCLSIQKESGNPLGQILVDEGLVGDREFTAFLGMELGLPVLDLSKITIDPEVRELISKDLVKRYQVMPVSRIGNTLNVAMVDPMNVIALDDIRLITGLDVRPILVSRKDFLEAVNRADSIENGMERMLQDAETPDVEIRKEEVDDEIDIDSLMEQTEEFSIIKLVNLLLVQAIKERASDIHIEPFENNIRMRYRVDGILYDRTPPPKHMMPAIVSRIKIMSQLDIAERRLPQDGRFRIRVQGKDIDFRISTLPTSFGEKVVMRILDKSAVTMDLDRLGFHLEALEQFRFAINQPHGMVLLTGPTGSGKTTTLYAALMEINKTDINISTVEDPVEYQIFGVNQVRVRADIGLTFAAALRSLLRQDPDILLVGEIRDLETADIAVKCALTGHLVLSTLHTNDAIGSITRLGNMGLEPFLISSSVILVAAQRLPRKICPKCKEAVDIPEKVLRRAQLTWEGEKPVLYHGRGCKNCNMMGYRGRQALLETVTITDELRQMIVREASEVEVKKTALQEGMKTLRMVGLGAALRGETTLEEVLRVTAPD